MAAWSESTGPAAWSRHGIALACWAVASIATAQQGSIVLSTFPSIGVADGRSTLTLSAEVRDGVGRLVRDGTQVVFETDRGSFLSRNVVGTQAGLAKIVMTAPSQPGTARVRATVFALNAASTLDIEFFADRTLLDSALDYVEVVAPAHVDYSPQHRLFEARDSEARVEVKYRDISVSAARVQLTASTYELRASGATLEIGGRFQAFQQLYMRLDRRRGFGVAIIEGKYLRYIRNGPLLAFEEVEGPRLSVIEVSPGGFAPGDDARDLRPLDFQDLESAVSFVRAKKAVVFPSSQIQFHRATLTVGDQNVMSLPLFQLSTSTSAPLVTEQFVNVSNSSLNVNYPHYVSLKPGETSLLRFRYGQRSGTGLGSTGGMFLDYEMNWNKGYDKQGGLVVSGLARDDWSVGIRQAWNGSTSVSAQLDFPAHRSMFANVGLSQPLGAYRLSALGQYGRSLSGERFESNLYNFSLERTPMPLGGLPAQLTYGLTASARSIRGSGSNEQVSANIRLDSEPLEFGATNSLRLSGAVGVARGRSVDAEFTRSASAVWDVDFGNGFVASTGYEYSVDGFTDEILGAHRLSSQLYWRGGPLSASAYFTQSLDLDRFSLSGSLDYRLSPLWRLSYGLYTDRYDGDSFGEQTVVLGYRLGFREVGLSYSTRTRRLGLELLGTRFN